MEFNPLRLLRLPARAAELPVLQLRAIECVPEGCERARVRWGLFLLRFSYCPFCGYTHVYSCNRSFRATRGDVRVVVCRSDVGVEARPSLANAAMDLGSDTIDAADFSANVGECLKLLVSSPRCLHLDGIHRHVRGTHVHGKRLLFRHKYECRTYFHDGRHLRQAYPGPRAVPALSSFEEHVQASYRSCSPWSIESRYSTLEHGKQRVYCSTLRFGTRCAAVWITRGIDSRTAQNISRHCGLMLYVCRRKHVFVIIDITS